MYAYIRGVVTELTSDKAVVEACGVGYEMNISGLTSGRLILGEEAKLYTHLHLGDGIQALYGFYDTEERDMFRQLISISRVGPKLSLSILSFLAPGDIAAAVVTDTPAAFERVPGMGKKTAQRVILELKEQVKAQNIPVAESKGSAVPVAANMQAEAVAALTALGYDGLTASRAVTAVEEAKNVEELITKALRKLAR